MRFFLCDLLRKRINDQNRKRLKNKDFSLLASNCNGGFICHDLGVKFRSPFVNLWLEPADFLEYLENIKYYMHCELKFINDQMYNHPIGKLDDVKIYFQHYKSQKEAKEKWIERTSRINLDNLFIIFTDRDGCTYQELIRFDQLPYKNKIVFTNQNYPEIKSSVYIPGFEKEKSVGNCFEYVNYFSGKRRYDCFDYVSWFNSEKIKKDVSIR